MSGFETTYLGELRTENTHLQSGTKILTDAPTDNQGKGAAFSPTDLCALSLTNCIITTMGIYCNSHGY
jgi:putative redox protein